MNTSSHHCFQATGSGKPCPQVPAQLCVICSTENWEYEIVYCGINKGLCILHVNGTNFDADTLTSHLTLGTKISPRMEVVPMKSPVQMRAGKTLT